MTVLEFILLTQLNTFLGNLNGQANDLMTSLVAIFTQLANILLQFAAAVLPPYS